MIPWSSSGTCVVLFLRRSPLCYDSTLLKWRSPVRLFNTVGYVSVLVLLTCQNGVAQVATHIGAPSRRPPPLPMNDAGGVPYWGIVTEIGRDSISVRIDLPSEQPKRFPLSETLAAGKVPTKARSIPGRQQPYSVMPSDMYRITDVRVGDSVIIRYSFIDGIIQCDHVSITRRPGGRIPPIPDEADACSARPRDPMGLRPDPTSRTTSGSTHTGIWKNAASRTPSTSAPTAVSPSPRRRVR